MLILQLLLILEINMNTQAVLDNWPEDSRQVANDIIKKYGKPDELTPSLLIWYDNDPWVKTVVSKQPIEHTFPMPHTDIVEQYIRYDVPSDKFDELAKYDGSVTVKRTEGLMSARCHDEPANFLALNLAHDVISDTISPEKAKEKYLQILIDYRKKKQTPYMEKLHFTVPSQSGDPGKQMITNDELSSYKKES